MLDTELRQGPAQLRRLRLGHLLASLGREEVMAAAIRVQRAKQAVPLHHLAEPPECRGGAFLLDQEHRVDRPCRVIERDNQIELRLAFEPGKPRAVLMQHRANNRPARTLLAMRRTLDRRASQARQVQMQLRDRVTQAVAVPLGQLLVKMLDREIGVLVPEQPQHPLDLHHRRPPGRRPAQPAIRQPRLAVLIEPVPPTPEGPLVDPQHLGCLTLRELAANMAAQNTLKTHPPQSLVKCCPVHCAPLFQGTLEPDNSRATNTGQITS